MPRRFLSLVLIVLALAACSHIPKSSRVTIDGRAVEMDLPREKTVTLPGGVELELILIPAGDFMMGNRVSVEQMACDFSMEPDWFKSSNPLHRVRITRPFYIGKYELTQAQWRAITGANPSHFKGLADSDRRPVECVSWIDVTGTFVPKVQAYAPEGWTFRLPTEAEWEYSARAGSQDYFPSGDTLKPDQVNAAFPEHKPISTTPMGSYAPNAWGLYDVVGNVWEWCQDAWDEDFYSRSPLENPRCEKLNADAHVLRGGSWDYPIAYCRLSHRGWDNTSEAASRRGLRLVLAPR